MLKHFILIPALLSFAFVSGCGGTQVTRTETNTTVDLSGKWNDTDSRLGGRRNDFRFVVLSLARAIRS